MVISENYCTFIVLNYKWLQTIIAMITEDKVTELFCMADDFCKFFDVMMEQYTLKSNMKRCVCICVISSRASPKEANALWDGSLASNCI